MTELPVRLKVGGAYLMTNEHRVGYYKVLAEYKKFYVLQGDYYTTTIFKHSLDDALQLVDRV